MYLNVWETIRNDIEILKIFIERMVDSFYCYDFCASIVGFGWISHISHVTSWKKTQKSTIPWTFLVTVLDPCQISTSNLLASLNLTVIFSSLSSPVLNLDNPTRNIYLSNPFAELSLGYSFKVFIDRYVIVLLICLGISRWCRVLISKKYFGGIITTVVDYHVYCGGFFMLVLCCTTLMVFMYYFGR